MKMRDDDFEPKANEREQQVIKNENKERCVSR